MLRLVSAYLTREQQKGFEPSIFKSDLAFTSLFPFWISAALLNKRFKGVEPFIVKDNRDPPIPIWI
jgi:hypothetical protein